MSSPYSSELRKVTEREKPFMEKLNSDDQVISGKSNSDNF